MNIPLGVVALGLTARFIRESRAERARRFDPLAQVLVIAALLALTSAVIAILGIGLGMVNAPITNSAVSGMPRSHAGLASAVATTSRQVGASLGVALAGALAGTGIESAHGQDFAAATHVFFWVSAGLGVAIVVLGIASTGPRARASASRVAFLLDATPRSNA